MARVAFVDLGVHPLVESLSNAHRGDRSVSLEGPVQRSREDGPVSFRGSKVNGHAPLTREIK